MKRPDENEGLSKAQIASKERARQREEARREKRQKARKKRRRDA
jgi:hypothetical protein